MNYLQQKKRALISVHRSFIPSGYKQVEYLESTGTQYISLPGLLNNDIITAKALTKSTSNYRSIIGCNRDHLYELYFDNGVIKTFKNIKVISVSGSGTNRPIEVQAQKQGDCFNGNLLFDYNTSNQYNLIGNIYEFQIKRAEKIVLNLIPCLDNNNRPCMYDTVSKKTYYNKGTGEFLYGEVIN